MPNSDWLLQTNPADLCPEQIPSWGRSAAQGIKLWLDDIRTMPPEFDQWAKNAEMAKSIVDTGNVIEISFDHDLGLEPGNTGYEVAKHIEEGAYHGTIPPMRWSIHSANPSGAANITMAMRKADEFWKNPIKRESIANDAWLFREAAPVQAYKNQSRKILMNVKGLSKEDAEAKVLELLEYDPSGREKGAYLPWLTTQYANDMMSNPEEAMDLIRTFEDAKSRNLIAKNVQIGGMDINQLRSTVDSVRDKLLERIKENEEKKQRSAPTTLPAGAKVIYNKPPYLIIEVTNPQASVEIGKIYGCSTAWCVVDYEKYKYEYAEEYLEDGPLYFFAKNGSMVGSLSSDGEMSDRSNDDANIRFNQEMAAVAKDAGIPVEIDNASVEQALDNEEYVAVFNYGVPDEFAKKILAELDSYELSYVLADQPSLATPELMAKLNPGGLRYVLVNQPRLATPELMTKLTPDELANVLAKQPRLATPELMTKLTPDDLSYVLADQPSLATPELMAKLTPDDLRYVLAKQPSLATPELMAKLTPDELSYVLAKQPSLKNVIKQIEEITEKTQEPDAQAIPTDANSGNEILLTNANNNSWLTRTADYPKHPDTVIIKPNEWYPSGLDEKTIWSYYDANKAELVKQLSGAPALIVMVTPGGPVIRRNDKSGQPIRIDTVEEFDKYNNGRSVEFHKVMGKTTDVVWVDIDPMQLVPWEKVVKIAEAVKQAFLKFKAWGITVSFSGGRGFHVRARLPKSVDIDTARKMVIRLMDDTVVSMFPNVTTGINHSPDGTRLDVSTLHDAGSLRVPGSLNAKTGLSCMDIRDTKKELSAVEKGDFALHPMRKLASAFKFDPNSTENEGRWRLRDPQDFDQDTFRRWHEWAGVKAPKGVAFIIGNIEDGKKAIQTIRFDKKLWDEKKASEYWQSIQSKPGFEKLWSSSDWRKSAGLVRESALTPEKSEKIRKMLADTATKHGFRIYGTGGYVRDRLMGYIPDDFDVAVYKDGMDPEKAKIEFAKLLVSDYGLPAPVSYGQTNTQFIDIDGDKVEVNNHGRNLEEEAKNRDYTVNSLFEDLQNPGSEIVDITGLGMQDIKDKILRSADPSNPSRLFQDSPERVMRGIRFMASRGMEFEPETLEALKNSVNLLADTAKENIGREFMKMMGHKASPKAWRLATELGIAEYIIPEWKSMRGVTQRPDYHSLDVEQHTLKVLENVAPGLVEQLVAILHDTGKPAYRKIEDSVIKFHEHEVGSKEIAEKALRELGFPEDIRNKVVKLVGEHMRAHSYRTEWSDKSVRKLMRDLGGDIDAALEIARADILGGNPDKAEERLRILEELGSRIKSEQSKMTSPVHEMKPLLNGNEMQNLFGRPPGKWIGEATKYLMDLQLGDPNMTKDQAIEAIKSWLEQGQPAPAQEELDHFTYDVSEGKLASITPQKIKRSADLPPLDQLDISRLDDTMYWVWSYGNGYSHAQAYDTEAEADAVAKKIGRNKDIKVLILTPDTIKMSKESPNKGKNLWDQINEFFVSSSTNRVFQVRRAEIEVRKNTQNKSGLIVGASGFGHESWLGGFYPKATLQKDRLSYYAKHFGAVEITATRHSIPPTRVLENWNAVTPDGFVFSFCAPITVRPSNPDSPQIMRRFMRRIAVFGKKLGPVVLHIDPLEKYSDGDAARFFDSLPSHRYAVLVESDEWQNQEVLDEMLKRNIVAVDTKLGKTVTDKLGWCYKRIASDLVVHLPHHIVKDNTNLVFVEDKSSLFPSKELMQAMDDLGLTADPRGPLSLVPNSMGPGGEFPTGPSNSGKSSGTEVSDGISLEPEQPNHKKVKKDFGRDIRNTEPMSIGDSENNSDGKARPFGNNVDGKTSDTASYTDPNSGF